MKICCGDCKWFLRVGLSESGICDNPSSDEFGKVIIDMDHCKGFERYYGYGENGLESRSKEFNRRGKV